MSNSANPKATRKELRWIPDLLSTSLPLEYEIAGQLVQRGYDVTPSYSYLREDGGAAKEYSVDLHAKRLLSARPETPFAQLSILLELKYRRPGVSWLFFKSKTTSSSFGPHLLRCLDAATLDVMPFRIDLELEKSMSLCFKGAEIDLQDFSNRRVHMDELEHGLQQLQFAVPWLVREQLISSIMATFLPLSGISAVPFFVPILLTTAPLYVAHDDTSEGDILRATSLTDFAGTVPFLAIDIGRGPRIQAQTKATFREKISPMHEGLIDSLEKHKSEAGPPHGLKPKMLLTILREGESWIVDILMRKALICNISSFDLLLSKLEQTVLKAEQERITLPKLSGS